MEDMRCCALCGILIFKIERPLIVYGCGGDTPRMIHGDCEPAFKAFVRNV